MENVIKGYGEKIDTDTQTSAGILKAQGHTSSQEPAHCSTCGDRGQAAACRLLFFGAVSLQGLVGW